MIKNILAPTHRAPLGVSSSARGGVARIRPEAGFWATSPSRAGLWLAATLLPAALGCAHASAPCPTPPAQLDRHRAEVERLDAEVGRARGEERELMKRRERTQAGIAWMQARLDSLAAAGAIGTPKR